MPRKKHDEVKAGAFVLLAVAALLGVVIWLGASSLFQKVHARATFVSDASLGPLGLKVGFPIKLGDVEIGKVTDIRYDSNTNQMVYEAEIYSPGCEVHADGKARVSAGLFGQAFVIITSLGSAGSPAADPAHAITLGGGLDSAMVNIRKITDKVLGELDANNRDSVLASVKTMIAELQGTVARVDKAMASLTPELDPKADGTMAANLKTTLANLASTTGRIDTYTKDDLGKILAGVRQVSDTVLKASNDLSVALEDMRRLVSGNADNVDQMVDNLVAVSENLKATSTEVRRNPWRLLYQPDGKQLETANIYDAARAFDSGASQLNLAVNKLRAVQSMGSNNPELAKTAEHVRKQLLECFESFRKAEDALWKELQKQSK